MRRSSVLYRRIWYAKRRNLRTINLCMRLFLAALILVPAFSFTGSRLLPALQAEAERAVSERVETIIEDTVREVLSDTSLNNSLFIIDRDNSGGIQAVEINTAELNRLTAYIAENLSARLQARESSTIGIPLGNIAGFGLMYGQGPIIKTYILSSGKAEVSYASTTSGEQDSALQNLVTINIRVTAAFHGPFVNGGTVLTSSIPVAEDMIRN